MSNKVYAIYTERILEALDRGVIPWRKPWKPGRCSADDHNATSGHEYRGANTMMLSAAREIGGYESTGWLTFKQANQLGGKIRKGEKSSLVVYWKFTDFVEVGPTGKETKKTIPLLRYYRVFNVDQTDGCKLPKRETVKAEPDTPITNLSAQTIVDEFPNPPTIRHYDGDRAYYSPIGDRVSIPQRRQFASESEYFGVLFHELGHSSGHASRLDRPFGKAFGTVDYSREELVAEMTSCYLCSHADIDRTDMNAAYIASWKTHLSANTDWLVWAASRAEKAALWILGKANEAEKPKETTGIAA